MTETTPSHIERTTLLGTPVDCPSTEQVEAWLEETMRSERRDAKLLLATNPEKVLILRKDAELRSTFEQAGLLLPDGVGVCLVMRHFYQKDVDRITGVETFLKLVELASKHGQRVFLFGSSEDVSGESQEILQERFPELQIAGRASGYLNEKDLLELPQRIRHLGTDVLFIALGSPRQEKWMQEFGSSTGAKIIQGVGGSLDVLTGKVPRAPRWMRASGLEWLGRLMREPKRIFRQWRLLLFIVLALFERLGLMGKRSA